MRIRAIIRERYWDHGTTDRLSMYLREIRTDVIMVLLATLWLPIGFILGVVFWLIEKITGKKVGGERPKIDKWPKEYLPW